MFHYCIDGVFVSAIDTDDLAFAVAEVRLGVSALDLEFCFGTPDDDGYFYIYLDGQLHEFFRYYR